MSTTLRAFLVALAVTAAAWGQPSRRRRPASPRPPATRPATRVQKAPDVAKGPVDPYDAAAERAKFFKAAGPDNELDQKEFAAAAGKKDSFVRKFDRWEAMLAYDKNSNKTIDWFEADAYRRKIRERVLKAFDADKNKQLKGEERDKANAMLAAGRVPAESGGRSGGIHAGRSRRDGPPGRSRGGDREMSDEQRAARIGAMREEAEMKRREAAQRQDFEAQRRQEAEQEERMRRFREEEERRRRGEADREEQNRRFREEAERRRMESLERRDRDRDGGMSDEERAAMARDMQERMEAERREGERDRAEADAEQAQREEQARRAREEAEQAQREEQARRAREDAERRRRESLQRYDKNGDGEVSGEERSAMVRDAREQWLTRRYDSDRDGKLNEKERAAMEAGRARQEERMRRYREEREKYERQMREKYDADHDGKLNEKENAAMQEGMRKEAEAQRQAMRARFQKLRAQADADGNGQTSGEEWRSYWQKTRARYDADGDGRLNEEENTKMRRELFGESSRPLMFFGGGRRGRGRGQGGPRVMVQPRGGATIIRNESGSATVIVRPIEPKGE
jgi:hypothetical protein